MALRPSASRMIVRSGSRISECGHLRPPQRRWFRSPLCGGGAAPAAVPTTAGGDAAVAGARRGQRLARAVRDGLVRGESPGPRESGIDAARALARAGSRVGRVCPGAIWPGAAFPAFAAVPGVPGGGVIPKGVTDDAGGVPGGVPGALGRRASEGGVPGRCAGVVVGDVAAPGCVPAAGGVPGAGGVPRVVGPPVGWSGSRLVGVPAGRRASGGVVGVDPGVPVRSPPAAFRDVKAEAWSHAA